MKYYFICVGILGVLYAADSVVEIASTCEGWFKPIRFPYQRSRRQKHKQCFFLGVTLSFVCLPDGLMLLFNKIEVEVAYVAVFSASLLIYAICYIRNLPQNKHRIQTAPKDLSIKKPSPQ